MIWIFLFCILCALLFGKKLLKQLEIPSNYPPGPKWLPIVGNTPLLKKLSRELGGQHNAFSHLAAQYKTKVLGLKLGSEYVVIALTKEVVQEVFLKDDLQFRPSNFFTEMRSMFTNKGITMTNGHLWYEQKNFALRHLRQLGFGKNKMESLIIDELKDALLVIEKEQQSSEILTHLSLFVLNVLYALVAGSRFSHGDPNLKNLLNVFNERRKAFDMLGGLLSQMPWLRFIAPEITGYSLMCKINSELSNILKEIVKQHKETMNDRKTEDFIYDFLEEMKTQEGMPTTFTDDQLLMVCMDFFIAGAETTSNTLAFALLSMIHNPAIQDKVQSEIKNVLGPCKLPALADRIRMPYVEAVLMESHRFMNVVPVAGPRQAICDTTIHGYSIPKGTIILSSLVSVHHDETVWDEPSVFRPERFLNENGDFKFDEPLFHFGLGPAWLPVVGNYFLFRSLLRKHKYTFKVWEILKERYGPLLGVRLGFDRIVVISGKELVRELLSKEELEGRPDGFIFRLRAFGKKLGVVFTDGSFGFEQRKFFLKHVREFGFGRCSIEESITTETTQFISELNKKAEEGPVDISHIAIVYMLNNLWHMMAGKRFSERDSKLNKLLSLTRESFKLQDMSGGLLNQMPFIRFIAPEKSTYNEGVKIISNLIGFFQETLDEHKKTFDSNHIRDYIDAFLLQKQNKENDPTTSFTEEQLIVAIMDMFMAGSDSTSNVFSYVVIYLIHNPHIQILVQEELDAVVGRDRWPSLSDRPNLPYTEAMLMEVFRISNIGAITVAHRAKRNVPVRNYVIPKDSIVLFSIYSVQMDKKVWGDPENFRPERFLDDKRKIIQSDSFIPFSLGRRRCLGESLSRPTLFLFVTALLHNFIISSPPGMPLPSKDPVDGAILTAQPFTCILTPRS